MADKSSKTETLDLTRIPEELFPNPIDLSVVAATLPHANGNVTIVNTSEPGAGGASSVYLVTTLDGDDSIYNGVVAFKTEADGPGLTNEQLLAIIDHRLSSFQSGPYPCKENEQALVHVRTAANLLAYRTADRQARGVEGKLEA